MQSSNKIQISNLEIIYIDDDGFLYITGRVKDIFKTSKGKYIEPSVLESYFGKVTEFQQLCIVGLGLDQPILLAVPTEIAKNDKEKAFEFLCKNLNEKFRLFENDIKWFFKFVNEYNIYKFINIIEKNSKQVQI